MPKLFLLFFISSSWWCFSQWIELDDIEKSKVERGIELSFLKSLSLGGNSISQVDTYVELVSFKTTNRLLDFILTLNAGRTFLIGNADYQLNTLGILLNPNGGNLNGRFYMDGSLFNTKKMDVSFLYSTGYKTVNAYSILDDKFKNFFDHYTNIGFSFTNQLIENTYKNIYLSSISRIYAVLHSSSDEDRIAFFENNFPKSVFGYGIDFGLGIGHSIKVQFVASHILTKSKLNPSLNKPVFRINIGYNLHSLKR